MTRHVFVVIFFTVIFFLVLPLPFLPLGRDQDIAAFNGMAFAKGVWPYLGYYDFNLISQAFVDSIIYRIFGTSVLAIRMFELVFLCLTTFLVYDLFKNKLHNRLWFLVVFYFVFSYMSLGYYHTGERDCFILFSLIIGMYLFHKIHLNSEKLFLSFLLGIIMSTVIFLRWTYFILIFAFMPLYYFSVKDKKWKHLLSFLAGFMVLPLIFILSYYLKGGTEAISQIYINLFVFSRKVYRYWGSKLFSIEIVRIHFSYFYYIYLCSLIFFLILVFDSHKHIKKTYSFFKKYLKNNYISSDSIVIFIFALIVTMSYAVVFYLQGSFQMYHLVPLSFFSVVIFIFLANWIITLKLSMSRQNTHIPVLIWLMFVLALILAPNFLGQINNIVNNYKFFAYKTIINKPYSPQCYIPPYFCPEIQRELVEYINRLTDKDDYIQLWSPDTGPYFLSDKLSPTKFPFPHFLWIPDEYAKNILLPEFLSELQKNPPKLFIVENFDRQDKNWTTVLKPNIQNYLSVINFLNGGYKLSYKVKFYDIYMRVN